MRVAKIPLVLVWIPIGWESGASFVKKKQNVVMRNQSNREITFDTQLKTALWRNQHQSFPNWHENHFSFLAAVKSIKKQHLVEVRSMGNPPPAVKLALESICLLLGEQAAEWRTIRGVIIKDNFISTVVNFSTEDIS